MSNTHHHDHVGDHDHDDEQNYGDGDAGGETVGGETAAELSVRRESRLRVAMWLNTAIVAVQVVFGFIAHSLGLIADAGHNLTDVAAVVASLVAVRLARRPANRQRSFGYHRATVLAAQANATSILVVTAVVTYEAIRRLIHPTPVDGKIVIAVALGAAACNLAAVLVLRESHAGHSHGEDLNMRSAVLHMAGDTAASLGVAATGVVIAATGGWFWLDPAISIAIGALIAVQAWSLLRQTVDVLLESTRMTSTSTRGLAPSVRSTVSKKSTIFTCGALPATCGPCRPISFWKAIRRSNKPNSSAMQSRRRSANPSPSPTPPSNSSASHAAMTAAGAHSRDLVRPVGDVCSWQHSRTCNDVADSPTEHRVVTPPDRHSRIALTDWHRCDSPELRHHVVILVTI